MPGLPPAAVAVAAARAVLAAGGSPVDAAAALDAYAPAIDEYADAAAAADWLGISRASVYQERSRTRADGTPGWPASEIPVGRGGRWRYRTIAVHRASLPGRGAFGRGRPAKLGDRSNGCSVSLPGLLYLARLP